MKKCTPFLGLHIECSTNPLDTRADLLGSEFLGVVEGNCSLSPNFLSTAPPKSSVSLAKGKSSLSSTGWYSGEYFCVLNTIKIIILFLHLCILK